MENMIEVTGVDLVELAQHAYDLSSAQGMGFLHATDEPLSKDDALQLIDNESSTPLSMDYVIGRACKLTVFKEDERLFIHNQWFDHSERQLEMLLERIQITPK